MVERAAQVHRYGDSVAVYIGTGPGVYMHPKDARRLARALVNAAKSVKNEPNYSTSTFSTVGFDFRDNRMRERSDKE